ncbi:MAG: hypothetical protein HYW01_01645 [Deltaproteobacteria bacterium]|nr:hypothetical protein [Deltaproteobacteria bacterium]
MKYLGLLTLLAFAIFYSACNGSDLIPALGEVDSKITEQDANAQNFDLVTRGYEMKVAIREDVEGDTEVILDSLDEMAADFLECQFGMGPGIGADDFPIEGEEIVPPLSELRVFVVPFNFECDAVDRDVCAGIFFPNSDLIIISENSLGRCGELPLWKHELGHRYGMALDHSNQAEFEPCINPPECEFSDFLDSGIGE